MPARFDGPHDKAFGVESHTGLTGGTMQVLINGESQALDRAVSVAKLLEQNGLAGKRIAVEINESIVPKSQHAERMIEEGDRIEIIHAIGGG